MVPDPWSGNYCRSFVPTSRSELRDIDGYDARVRSLGLVETVSQ